MFNLWKKRRQNTGKHSVQPETVSDMDSKEIPGDTPDTVKLVESTDSKDILPEKVEEPDDHTDSQLDAPVENRFEEDMRNAAVPPVSQTENVEQSKVRRKSSISSVKWADLSKDSTGDTVSLEKSEQADDIDEPARIPSTGNNDKDARGTVDEDLPVVLGLACSAIPEETEDTATEDNPSAKMSSADTDDCGESSVKKEKLTSTVKAENPKFLSSSFPGLRKDSIDMYKKRRQNQDHVRTDPADDQYSVFKPWRLTSEPPRVPQTDLPSASILKRRSSGLIIDKEVRQSVFTILSGMYAMFLTILGAVLPIAELFAHEKHPLLFEIFYIYMYGGSILFLGYVYTYLLRSRAAQKTDPPGHKRRRRKRKVSVDKVSSNTGSFYLRLGAVAFGIGSMIHSGLQFGDYFEVKIMDPCRHAIFAVRPIVHLIFTFVQLYFVFMNSKMCINRFKVIARFGLMHMVATNICVWFNTIVEETLHQLKTLDTPSHSPMSHEPVLYPHGVMTKPPPNRTLLSHAHAVNASIKDHVHGHRRVLQTVTQLTTTTGHFIAGHTHHENMTQALTEPGLLSVATLQTEYDCQTSELMLSVLETVGPYLYPCSIEYSLICAGIVYTLWKNIGKRVMAIKTDDGSDERSQVHRLRVDCSNSSRGLFMGILILVGTIITMVVFFVLVKTPSYNESAVMVEYLSEITLFALSSVAVVIAALRMRYLRFNVTRDTDFEEVLILISLTGDYMFQMLSIVAAIFDGEQFASRLSITACLLGITQSTLQTMFVLDGLRRCTRTPEQGRQKHGREYVTFLLITNIAMWCINTFEAERTVANPVQMHYYGALAWNILSHISIPLAIFFRFHSTVCLSNIWKRAWKSYS